MNIPLPVPPEPVTILDALRQPQNAAAWRRAADYAGRNPEDFAGFVRRRTTLRLLSTTTAELLARLLPAGGLAVGLDLEVDVAPYGQLEQELLDGSSDTARSNVQWLLLSLEYEDLGVDDIPDVGPDAVVAAAVARWTGLWAAARAQGKSVLQQLAAPPATDPWGAAAMVAADSPTAVVARINNELRRRAETEVLIDAELLARRHGSRRWRNDRYYFATRQAVALDALPLLASTITATLAAELGLSRRCLVLDLDNTLWDGVVGEEGIEGLSLTGGPRAESFRAFQAHLLGLRSRGVALAVASKNDIELAERAIAEVDGMRLRPEHFVAVVADWRPKSEQIIDIAARLGLGLDAVAFVDDNPAECLEVRRALPEVDVIELPAQPFDFVAALAERPTLHPPRATPDDRLRAASYQGLREAESVREQHTSVEEFLDDLRMRAVVRVVDHETVPRAAQLVGKTNQFNLTSLRRSEQELAELSVDSEWICLTLSLRDRLADHGVVGLALARKDGPSAIIDTLLLSCRVIGRTAERVLLEEVGRVAASRGCAQLVGLYRPTARNGLVADLYPRLGFAPAAAEPGRDVDRFTFDLAEVDLLKTCHISREDV